MMKHKMRLQRAPFEQIKKGEKTVELRLYDEKRQKIRVGDVIEFSAADAPCDSIDVTVIALHRFSNFAELFDVIPAEKCGFSKGASYAVMESYYTVDEQNVWGVVGIEVEKNF